MREITIPTIPLRKLKAISNRSAGDAFNLRLLLLLQLLKCLRVIPTSPSPPASCFPGLANCKAANYWYSGFTRLQSLIDAAIIQVPFPLLCSISTWPQAALMRLYLSSVSVIFEWIVFTDADKALSAE